MTEEKKAFSFGFSKVKSSKLVDSALRDEATKDVKEETDFVLEVNSSEIKGTKKKEEKKELIIPCLGNTYKKPLEKIEEKKDELFEKDEKDLTEEEKAAKALLQDSKRWQEERDTEDKPNSNLVIESGVNNGILDEKSVFDADLDARPEVSSINDYENIPVDGFGMAMLRGMGFKKEEGIGGFRKEKVDCIEPVMRPKGLGLGASVPKNNKKDSSSSKSGDKKEELVLKRGAYVRIQSGKYKGQYGEVEGLDEENARVVVRIHGECVSVSENIINLVDKAEFKKCKNVINNDMYNEYSEKQKEREKEWNKSDKRSLETEPDEFTKKSKKSKSTWVRRGLRVRLIDKKSKYYKEKVVVNDVIAHDRIECITSSGRVLDDVDPYNVESVIPRDEFSVLMIVRGSEFKGKLCELLKKDSKRELVAVRLLPDKEEVLKLGYDDVCEMTGDITEYL